jgi:hypothetical protein
VTPTWLSAFLDFAPDDFERGVAHWEALTGYPRSESRGDSDQFATLEPPTGDDFLRVQRLGEGPTRVHLDVHVDDPAAAAREAVGLGAIQVAEHPTYAVLTSPGGLTFCLVSHARAVRPAPSRWPGGHTSLLDQVCLDIAPDHFDGEAGFWQALTGWELRRSAAAREFAPLVRPAHQPLRILLQRLDESDGPVSAHLDWATTDREAEAARHVALGSQPVRRFEHWTVMRDPVGTTYCITGRSPETGMLP